ncbi:MAG: VWA domain-containing protein [Candidatus Micrarchaeota archaeon]
MDYLLKDILSRVLQEIGLFTSYLCLREGKDINIDFSVEYSKGDYLGLTKVDENGRRTIVLNLDRNELKYGPHYESKIRGVILHEEAHNMFTPMSSPKDLLKVFKRLSQEFPEIQPRIIEYVVNLVEDYRVEYLFKREYPGSVRNFSDIYTAILDEFAGKYNPDSVLHLLYLARMATATEHQKTSDFENMIPRKLKDLYYEFVKNIEETTGKGFDSTETAARKILEKIKDYVKEDKSNDNETELDNLEKLPKLFGGYVKGRISTSGNLPYDIEEALNEAKREQNLRLSKNLKFAKRGFSGLRPSQPNLQKGQVNGYYSYDLRKTLEEYYGGSSLETKKSLFGGRLNEREIIDRLVRREPLAGPNVYLYEIRRSSVRGTDLFILADTSDSMSRDLKGVKSVLSTLVETTKGSKSINISIFGFPSAGGYLYDINPDEVNSLSVSGGTPLADALEELQREMKRRVSYNPDRNYLLFILTDGVPDNLEKAKMQLKKMKEEGIEIIIILTSEPPEDIKKAFAENRVIYLNLNPGREIDIERFTKELNKELLEIFRNRRFGKQKMY